MVGRGFSPANRYTHASNHRCHRSCGHVRPAGCDGLSGSRPRPGPEVVRRPHDGPCAAERLDVHHLRAAGRAGVLLRDAGRRRRRPGPQGSDRHGAHVRAHGLQGNDRRRHVRLREGETGARGDGSGLPGAAEGARCAPARRERDRDAHQGLRGRPDERAAVRETERVRRADLARGRRRAQRRDQLGLHDLLLRPAREQVRALRLSRVRALLAAGLPRVLQGARRRDRGTAHADREPARGPADREARRRGLHRASLQQRAHRPPQRPPAPDDDGRARVLRANTTGRRTS